MLNNTNIALMLFLGDAQTFCNSGMIVTVMIVSYDVSKIIL